MTTAFVLTGGGSLGAIQAGMLAELLMHGERPDMVIGVSAGAINGVMLAQEPSSRRVAALGEHWASMTTKQALGLHARSFLGLLGLADHIGRFNELRQRLRESLGVTHLEALQIPTYVVCAELATGHARVFCEGEIIDRVLASAAIPGIYPAVMLDGIACVDGALASASPLSIALEKGATRLIVLPCGYTCATTVVPRRALGRAMHAITLLGSRQLALDIQHHAERVLIHVVPPLCPLQHSAYDFSHGRELIDRARVSTRTWIEQGGLSQYALPGALTPHTHSAAERVGALGWSRLH